MKWWVGFLLSWVVSVGAFGATPEQYATVVVQKDLPRSLRWFEKAIAVQNLSQAEIYSLYQSAMPESQGNKQLGISTKGSVERMVLFLEGSRFFSQVQKAPLDYQNKRDQILHILQTTKDEMDRYLYGEDPQVLIEEWRSLGVKDMATFTADLADVFAETQRLLTTPVVETAPEDSQDGVEMVVTDPAASELTRVESAPLPPSSFEAQRFDSYMQSSEAGRVANECQSALLWKTDQAESCQSDETLECDRSYARQCKKLQ